MTSEDTSVWNSFIQSLDVDPDKAKNIEQLPESQKRQLIESYTIKTSKHSAFHYVTLIKGLRSHRGSLSKSRKGNLQTAREVLNATEISLRTNNVSWVYEFLDKGGLQALQEYMSKTVQNMLSDLQKFSGKLSSPVLSSALPPSICRRRNCLHSTPNLGDDQLSMECLMEYSDRASTGSRSLFCHRGGTGSSNKKSSSRSASVNKCRHSSNKDNASVTTNCESIHLGVKCYRALLNNQRGCTMIFEQPESINTIALCLLHPSFQTKTLVLELLAAVCLIVGGHERVIAAFDEVCRELGESRRFETLVFFFRSHERLPSDDYSIDFMVSCMQFINIVVHSTEDIAFRVFLQQEFTNLRLDDYLQRISSRVGERLGRQVEAYLDNHVDVTTLLEDSQAKDALQAEVEALDSDLLAVQGQLATTQAEYASRTAAFEEKVKNLQAQISEQEAQLLDNKEELQNLRSRLVDQNSTASSVEKKLQQQITELQEALKAERNRPKVISPPPPPPSALPHTPAPPSTTSSVPSAPPPPPPPPPGSLESGIPAPPPPPMFGGGGAPGFGLAPAGSQAVPIRQPYQTRYKLPLMNWSVLRSQQLRNTIFVGMNDEKVIESLDMDRFEELFRLSSNSILSKSSNEVKSVSGNGENAPDSTTVIDGDSRNSVTSKKAMKKRLMDASRLRCMGILLRYLESEKFTLTKLWESITNLNVSLDVADRILHQLPTQEEARMYLNYEFTEGQPVDQLTDEDRLLLNLCKVNRLGPKLEVIVFMNTLDSTLASLLPKISAVNLASFNLKKSEKFKRLLELILAFGNYMNSCRRGVAYGFRLQSLEILLDTKTPDKQTTLLHFLVETVEEKFPDLVNFYDELDGITAASRVPMEALTSDVQAVVSALAEADKELIATGPDAPQRLVNFIREQSPRVTDLQTKAETARNIFSQTTEWFGEALNKPSPETFFTCVVKFIQQFKKVQAELEKRRLAEQTMAIRKQSGTYLHNGKGSSYGVPGTNVNATPSRQRNSKDEDDPSDLQRALAQEARLAKRRIQNRTRQINGDGMMDEILAALGSKPLQAEVHPRRSHFNNTNSSNNSSTDYLP